MILAWLNGSVCPPWTWHTSLGGDATEERGACLEETLVFRSGEISVPCGTEGDGLEMGAPAWVTLLRPGPLSPRPELCPAQWEFLAHRDTRICPEATSLPLDWVPGSDAGGGLLRHFWVMGSLQGCLVPPSLRHASPPPIQHPPAWSIQPP